MARTGDTEKYTIEIQRGTDNLYTLLLTGMRILHPDLCIGIAKQLSEGIRPQAISTRVRLKAINQDYPPQESDALAAGTYAWACFLEKHPAQLQNWYKPKEN